MQLKALRRWRRGKKTGVKVLKRDSRGGGGIKRDQDPPDIGQDIKTGFTANVKSV